MVKAVCHLAQLSLCLLYNIKLMTIRHYFLVNVKLVHSHSTGTENPEMLSKFRLRKEFETLCQFVNYSEE
jgi:hypothetical protein